MPTTVKIYPTNSAANYYQNTSCTSSGNGSIAYAGDTGSNNYTWPIPFNLSAYSDKILVSLKFKARLVDADSNTFSGGEYLGVGLSANNTPYSAVSGANRQNLGNQHLPDSDGNSWNEWDVSGAWDTLKAGLAYLVMYGNEYAGHNTNDSDVSSSYRCYLELIYEDGTVGVKQSDGIHRCQIYQKQSDGLHLIQPFYRDADGLHQIST